MMLRRPRVRRPSRVSQGESFSKDSSSQHPAVRIRIRMRTSEHEAQAVPTRSDQLRQVVCVPVDFVSVDVVVTIEVAEMDLDADRTPYREVEGFALPSTKGAAAASF